MGTLERAGQSPAKVRLGYVLGGLVGGAMLGLLLAGAQAARVALFGDGRGWRVFLAFALAVIVVQELRGRNLSRFAGNFLVPPEWVTGPAGRVGTLWGVLLGMGFITAIPFSIVHAGFLAAVLQGSTAAAFGSGVVFGLARTLPGAFRVSRRVILGSMDRQIQTSWTVKPTSFGTVAARVGSEVAVAASAATLAAWLLLLEG